MSKSQDKSWFIKNNNACDIKVLLSWFFWYGHSYISFLISNIYWMRYFTGKFPYFGCCETNTYRTYDFLP